MRISEASRRNARSDAAPASQAHKLDFTDAQFPLPVQIARPASRPSCLLTPATCRTRGAALTLPTSAAATRVAVATKPSMGGGRNALCASICHVVHMGPKMMRLSGSIAKKITMPTMAMTTEAMIR